MIEKSFKAKFLKFKILKGRLKRSKNELQDASCALNGIQVFGSPSLSADNVQHVSVAKMLKLAKQVKQAMNEEYQKKTAHPKQKQDEPTAKPKFEEAPDESFVRSKL